MKIKSTVVGLILAATTIVSVVSTQAVWARHGYCGVSGWHMVSKSSDIRPAATWQEYNSGVYLQPTTQRGFLFLGY